MTLFLLRYLREKLFTFIATNNKQNFIGLHPSSNVTICKYANVFKVRYRLKDNIATIIHRQLRFFENYYEG